MRNCFVPQCDAYCKQHKIHKRMMFIAPRDNTIFIAWKKRLYNKREFRPKDKICERHFTKDQIVTHWDHFIDGANVQLQRDKPKLKATAIPTENLPEMHIPPDVEEHLQDDDCGQLKVLRKNDNNVKENKRRNEQNEEKEMSKRAKTTETNETEDSVVLLQMDVEHEFDTEIEQNHVAMFESLYDDIYEVVLPNTLWGIHRDPQRRFIAFSEFDAAIMNTAKLLHISDTLEMKAFMYNAEIQMTKRDDLTIEILTEALSELDEHRPCALIKTGLNIPECEILANVGEYCNNCTKTATL